MEQVKFYSKEDMASGYNLTKAENIIDSFDEQKEYNEINELIEFYNIIKYIDNEVFLKKWDEKYIQTVKDKIKKMKAKVFKWFNTNINNDTIIEEYKKLTNSYKEDFFEIINNIIESINIEDNTIKELLNKYPYHIYDILENKKIVSKYDGVITEHMNFDVKNSVKIFADVYLIKDSRRKLYIPVSLTKEKKEEIIKKYLDLPYQNINYLRLFINTPDLPEFGLSPRTKLLIKNEIKKQEEELFSKSGTKLSTEFLVRIVPNLGECKQEIFNDRKWDLSYNLDWIKDNKDYPTLLNNFIYLFGFVDNQMRWVNTAKKSHLGIFEGHLAMHAKDDYIGGYAFQSLNAIADMQIRAYYDTLKKLDIRLEEIIEWFFNEYLKDEFGIKDFRSSMSSNETSYLEKCRFTLPEIEGALKKYNYYIEDGYINHELVDMTSTPIPFSNVKSILNNKYLYPNQKNDDYILIDYALFSDQCMLKYVERIEQSYSSFCELLRKENIKISDIDEFDMSLIEKLKQYNLITINADESITISDRIKVGILKDLHENEFISFWKYPKIFRDAMIELVNNELVFFESSLLSKSEVAYLNYYLNRKEFINSLDLRNKYDHGTKSSGNEQEHYQNYMVILRLFILIIIKINDELCVLNSEDYKSSQN